MADIQFVLYNLPESEGTIQAFVEDETIWLTQKGMAQLFGVEVNTINYHLKEIFTSNELSEEATIRNCRTVQTEGKRQVERERIYYNLDVIISVGYRVNSRQATLFRQWATRVLNEFIRKGFALDDNRLKQGSAVFGKDFFRELLERVRSIRASERRIWQQITDIYAECSIDYDRLSPTTTQNPIWVFQPGNSLQTDEF